MKIYEATLKNVRDKTIVKCETVYDWKINSFVYPHEFAAANADNKWRVIGMKLLREE